MRIYNGTNSQVDLPLAGNQRITIAPKSISGDILTSTELLSLLVTSYRTDELALVVSGPYELNLCAQVPTTTEYTVQTIDEAIQRFNPVKEEGPKVEEKEESEPEVVVEPKAEEEKPEPEVVEPEVVEEPKAEDEVAEEKPTTTKRGVKKTK